MSAKLKVTVLDRNDKLLHDFSDEQIKADMTVGDVK